MTRFETNPARMTAGSGGTATGTYTAMRQRCGVNQRLRSCRRA
ncbi:hypothetical protein [Nonomuraea dietziae]